MSEIFSFFERVCFASDENLNRVSSLAASEEWIPYDPTKIPGKNAVAVKDGESPRLISTERSSAWTTTIAETEVIVAITKAKRLERPQCEVITIMGRAEPQLDLERIHRRIGSLDGRGGFTKASEESLPMMSNKVVSRFTSRNRIREAPFQIEPAAFVVYTIETEDERVLHTIAFVGERMP